MGPSKHEWSIFHNYVITLDENILDHASWQKPVKQHVHYEEHELFITKCDPQLIQGYL